MVSSLRNRARAIRVTGLILELKVNLNIGTKVMDPESLGDVRWSGVELLDCVSETLIRVAETLLRAKELWIGAQCCGLAMTR